MYIYIHTYTCIVARVYMCTSLFTFIHLYIYTFIHVHVSIHTYAHAMFLFICIFEFTFIFINRLQYMLMNVFILATSHCLFSNVYELVLRIC